MRDLRPTPPQPVFYGQIHFGTFRDPFRTVNLIEADICGHRWAPRWWRNLRLKEWQRFAIVSDELYCGCVVFDAKYLAASFFCVYDRATGQMIEHKRTTMQRGAVHVPEQLYRGDGHFRQPGYHLQLRNRLQQGTHYLTADIRGTHDLPPVRAAFTIIEDLTRIQPLIVVLPVNDYRRPMYTHKAVCPVEGVLQVGDRVWALSADRCRALVDVQKTYYPREAFWRWASFAGQDQDGVPVAINLTHNMIVDDERWNECCAWVDGALSRFGAARFEFDPHDTQQPWRMFTTDGRADLVFTPECERAECLDLAGLVRSDFRQPFGAYTGYFVDDAGQRHEIHGAPGVAEHHLLKA
ncbi:MAG: DUF2804 domain-containing protein [Anaerolineae bacterium]|nr:DUF2804 domain-containing protein [Anaerolineae bacterium]